MKKNLIFSSIAALTLFGFLVSRSDSVTLPANEDTTSVKGRTASTITKTANVATTLTINGSTTATRKAFIHFNLGDVPAGTTAAQVSSARLRLYIVKVTKPGNLEVHKVTGPWNEATLTTANEPAFDPAVSGTISSADLASKNFVSVDITNVVKGWITTPSTNEGVAIIAAPTATTTNLTLGAKEGTGSGYPAELEIELASPAAGNGSAITNLNATNISTGTIAANLLPASVPLLNATSNVFTGTVIAGTVAGNGSLITSLNATNLSSGTIATSVLPSNVPLLSLPPAIGVNVPTGSLRFQGLLRHGLENGTAEGVSGKFAGGILNRRITSINKTAGRIVARTDVATLERDGTDAGFVIKYSVPNILNTSTPDTSTTFSVSATGVTSTGTTKSFHFSKIGVLTTQAPITVFANSDDIVYFRCQFGDTLNQDNHLTEVTFSRTKDAAFPGFAENWAGFVTSTFNQ